MSTLQTIGIIVGVVSGVSGVVLGIVNYWERRVSTRPRIVVRPGVWGVFDDETKQTKGNVGIMEVRNVGQVPVIGSTIGFLRRRGQEKGVVNLAPKSINGVKWTDELKPQHVVLLHFKLEGLPDADKLGCAFVKTIIGDTFKASRRDMRKFAKERKAAST